MTEHPQQWDGYGDQARPEVTPSLPETATCVLEVGCGTGGFGRSLRTRYPDAHIVGVEAIPEVAEVAGGDRGFDEVLAGYFPGVLEGRDDRFDLIVFNDVLEHIVDPWSLVDSLHDRLTPGGRVLASIPNVQYVWNLTDLLAGRWEYTDWGVLDRTHVRFFTRSSAIALFTDRGFALERCDGVNPADNYGRIDKRLLRVGLMRAFPTSRYQQYVVVARSLRR